MVRRISYVVFFLLLLCVWSQYQFSSDARSLEASQSFFPEEVGLPAYTEQDVLLQREAYTVCYDARKKIPRWVAWHLTTNKVSGEQPRMNNFSEDTEVPEPRATLADYKGSKYDRGHMCPAGDNKWSYKAMRESFLLTNICPQHHSLNAGDWNELELTCRRWAKSLSDIYIVAGPVFTKKRFQTIGVNKVAVPDAFFKVVLCLNDTPKAIGFLCQNHSGNLPLSQYVRTVDEIEQLTGLDFFALLPDDMEDRVESQADWASWP